jgi:branched-chain amino acid transport system permease protein
MTSSKLGKYLSGPGLLGLVIFLCVIPFYSTDYIVSVLLDILTWIGLTESWIILSGFTGYISLGHSAFFGIGAYVMAISWLKLPYPLIVLISATSSMALAFAIGFPVLRVRGPYFVILTLGLSEFAKYIFINYEVNVKGTVGRILLGVPNIRTLYFSLLIIAIVTIFCAYLIKRSRFGYGLFSIREDEDAAESLGIDTSIYKWLAFGISAFFPGAIGATMALRRTYIDAYSVFDPIVSFQIIVMAFFGGMGKLHGPVLGACILTLISEFLWARYPHYYLIILGVILVFIVKFMPSGILGIFELLGKAGKLVKFARRK